MAFLLLLVLGLLYRLRIVVIPILFAGVLAFLLSPFVDFLCRHKIPRSVASGLVVILAILVVSLLALLVIPTLFAQLAEIVMQVPVVLDVLDQRLVPWAREQFGVSLQLDRAAMTMFIQEHLQDLAAPSGWFLSRVFSSLFTLIMVTINTIIVVVFTFYLLRSYHNISAKFMALIPERFRAIVTSSLNAVDEALSAFVRGQIIVVCILAVVYATALSIIGINGGMVIGILAGLLGFVPYLGLVVGLVLSLLSIMLAYEGFGQVLAVLILFTGVPMLDGGIITPNIVGGKTGLNPFLVIVALLVGAELLGFLGLLMAVPTAAILRALLKIWLESYKNSRFYQGEQDESVQTPQLP